MENNDTRNDEFTEEENFFGDPFFEDESDEPDYDESELDLFPFDKPRVVTLKNGTVHEFVIPSLREEKRRVEIQRTIIHTSKAVVNGQNPRQILVDYSKSRLSYYQHTARRFKGYRFGEQFPNPDEWLDARFKIGEETLGNGKQRDILLVSKIPVKDQRSAAERLYGGKLEIVKPKVKEGERIVHDLNARVRIHVKQEFGIEQNADGSFTAPEYVVHYFLNEPNSDQLSKWEMQCFTGNTLNHPKGGSTETRIYNIEQCAKLFDSMIDEVKGGAVFENVEVDVRNNTHLPLIPWAIKMDVISLVMNDQTTDSGN